MKKELLTPEEEIEILKWCHANPTVDLTEQCQEWMRRFNCSLFSIEQTLVKEAIGQIKVPTKNPA